MPCVFTVLENEEKEEILKAMKMMKDKDMQIIPIVITDVKDKESLDFMENYSEKRIFRVP